MAIFGDQLLPREIRRLFKNIVPAHIRASISSSRIRNIALHMIRAHDSVYDQDYYDRDVELPAVQSAAVMAKSIVECFQPKTLIDVGCGTGALLEAFRNLNCQVLGLEYSEAGLAYCKRRQLSVRKFNIENDDLDGERFDAAVSFEVAEHISPWSADKFVDLLCNLSPLVVMSAATPGQGGLDHVNEQPHSYWIGKFERRGYAEDKKNSDRLTAEWKSANTAHWYYSNVMVFIRQS
jgi:SAM-dependent methyltransferase